MPLLINQYLGNTLDLSHYGDVVVADYKGNVIASCGDPDKVVFLRSSAKPIQALSFIESGAAERYGISPKELSVTCSSHNGEPFHVETVRGMLAKAGLDESFLKCGAVYPMYIPAEDELKKAGIPCAPIFCDCSGKHSGMLLTAKHLGFSLDDYYTRNHPVQERITKILARMTNVSESDISFGLDGCGVPVHAVPLKNAAMAYAKLSTPETIDNQEDRQASYSIVEAMANFPEMVAGTERLCTYLMKYFGNKLIGKAGANAYYAIGLRNKGIGIVVKMEGGASKMIPYVLISTLRQMGILTAEEISLLPWSDKNTYNSKNEIMGYLSPVFELT